MPKFKEHRNGMVSPHTEEHDLYHEMRDLLEAIYESAKRPDSDKVHVRIDARGYTPED